MIEPRGRPRRQYVLSRVRLINFHNLVDETIEIRSGGHLFLLGDNGSGKTTVIDAVHLVLSGEHEMELNAATRFGARRTGGRTLQGIVLRLDPERGIVNEGGAITYAAVELHAQDDGEKLCLGVGLEATTLEARVVRWGFLHRGPLEELPLLFEAPDGSRCPTPRERFREALGKVETFGHMTDYRSAVAERVFGSTALYEEVCRFWAMAKAYREIVAGARDFAALFSRLLPAPDVEIFAEILQSLREIDDLASRLGELDRQRDYVAGLSACIERIASHREEAARYRWLVTFREIQEREADAEGRRQQVKQLAQELTRAEAQTEGAKARRGRATEALRMTENEDAGQLASNLHRVESDLQQRAAEIRATRAELDGCRHQEQEAQASLDHAVGELAAALESACTDLTDTLRHARRALPATNSLLEDQRAAAGALGSEALDLAEPDAAAGREVEEAMGRVETEFRAAQDQAALRRRELADRERQLDALRPGPGLEGFEVAQEALRAAGLTAQPIFEPLEPSRGAAESDLAALEALVGVETLTAFVVPVDELERAKAVLLRQAPGVRVVCRTTDEATLPSWASALLLPPEGSTAIAARQAVAAALCQPGALGEVQPPDATGTIELRGLGFRQPGDAPVLIGAEHRKRAQARRAQQMQSEIARVQQVCAAADQQVDAVRVEQDRLRAVTRATQSLRGPAVLHAHTEARIGQAHCAHAGQRTREAAERLDAAERVLADTQSALDALRARADEVGLAELEKKLQVLRDVATQADQELGNAQRHHGQLEQAVADQNQALAVLEDELAARRRELVVRGEALRTCHGEGLAEADVERYVRTTARGDQFRTLAAIDERLREAERNETIARTELAGDGSHGIRNLEYAPRFGFAYQEGENRLEDRRGQPAANVLASLERDIAEQREVVNDKTRDLMDTLVMGTLARHLQEQVGRLHRTIKDINRLLGDLRFGSTRYQFRVTPRDERKELVELVGRVSLLDEASRKQFRAWIDDRMEQLKIGGDDDVPEVLDYRRWFEYQLITQSTNVSGETELTPERRVLSSGGEQGVPNYLLVLALAKLMFDNAGARVRPVLFDEAFYGIDSGRRDQLLRFATDLGLQLLVASPDQDGATLAVRYATTLFLVRDDNGDVHLAPYHYWNLTGERQPALFDQEPQVAPESEAQCVVGAGGAPVGGKSP